MTAVTASALVLPVLVLVAKTFSPTVRLEIGAALPLASSTSVLAVKLLPPTRHDPPSSVTSSVVSAAASTATSVAASAAASRPTSRAAPAPPVATVSATPTTATAAWTHDASDGSV